MPHDLLLKGGTLIDPSQSIHDDLDVAFTDGKVSSVARGISDSEARDVYDASGLIVTPGLIDLHAHAFWGASEPGLPPDPVNVAKGVTTIVDAGSSGARTFPAFRKWTIERSATRIYALLNISAMGMPAGNKIGELLDMRWADVDEAIDSWRANKEYIIGIKARLGRVQCLDSPVEALRRSLEVAEEIGGFVMIHVGNTATPLEELCAMLRPGDVVTHSFCGFEDVLIDGSGRVREGFKEAASRGVVFDVGHGGGGFSFINAERAMADGLPPRQHQHRPAPGQHRRAGLRHDDHDDQVHAPGHVRRRGGEAHHAVHGRDHGHGGQARDACGGSRGRRRGPEAGRGKVPARRPRGGQPHIP